MDRASLSVLAWSTPLALETTQRKQTLGLFGSGLHQGPQVHSCRAQEGAGPPWRPGCGLMQGQFSPGPCFLSHKEEVKLSYLEGPSTSEKSLRIHARPCGQYSVCMVSVDSISWGGQITNQGKVSGRRNMSRTQLALWPCQGAGEHPSNP